MWNLGMVAQLALRQLYFISGRGPRQAALPLHHTAAGLAIGMDGGHPASGARREQARVDSTASTREGIRNAGMHTILCGYMWCRLSA